MASSLTQAELLFGLAAEDPPTAVASEGARAVLRGRRFFHCNNGPFCSTGVEGTEFPLTAEQMEQDAPTMPCPECGKILGAIEIVPIPPQVCWLCREPITGKGAVSINPVSGRMALGCEPCVTKAGARPGEALISAMATHTRESHLPDCRICGEPYGDHYRPLTSIWDAYGYGPQNDDPDAHFWQPATPFRLRGWPHRMAAGYDHEKQEIIYADESAQEAAA